jgi:protein SCO1
MSVIASLPLVVLASFTLAGVASAVDGDGPMSPKPRELEGVEIADRLGATLPLDTPLTDESGKQVRLSDYFSGERAGKPVLLTLGYYECPMLCSLVLKGALDSLKAISLDAGRDFSVVSVSIDPKDTVSVARMKRQNYLEEYGREGAAEGWHFHVAEEDDVRRLADAVGFSYRWDARDKQYIHGAGIFFVSPDGVLTRTLYGISYPPNDVKFALMEASRGEVGTVTDKIMLSCFMYNPDGQRYGLYIWGLMRSAGVFTILLLGTLLFLLWRREQRRASS